MLLLACVLGLLVSAGTSIVVVYDTQMTPHPIVDEFRSATASFGSDLPLEGLQGLLVRGEPADGCKPLAKPPLDENFTGNWIVLLARHNCSFEVKVRNAQAAGYDCAIVHNVNSSDDLELMAAKDPDGIDIPSVFVTSVAGDLLGENYNYTNGVYIILKRDLPDAAVRGGGQAVSAGHTNLDGRVMTLPPTNGYNISDRVDRPSSPSLFSAMSLMRALLRVGPLSDPLTEWFWKSFQPTPTQG